MTKHNRLSPETLALNDLEYNVQDAIFNNNENVLYAYKDKEQAFAAIDKSMMLLLEVNNTYTLYKAAGGSRTLVFHDTIAELVM